MNASVIAEMKRLCEKHRWNVDFSLPDFRDKFIQKSCYDLPYIYKETDHKEFLEEFKSFLDLKQKKHIVLYAANSIKDIESFFVQFPEQDKKEFFRLRCDKLPEDTLTYFEQYIDFDVLTLRRLLSHEFIEKHLKKFNWNYICEYQKVSFDFIRQHIDLMNDFSSKETKEPAWNCLTRNTKINPKDIMIKFLVEYTEQLCDDIENEKYADAIG